MKKNDKITVGTKFYKPIDEDSYEMIRIINRVKDDKDNILTVYLNEENELKLICNKKGEENFLDGWKELQPNGTLLINTFFTKASIIVANLDNEILSNYCTEIRYDYDLISQFRKFSEEESHIEELFSIYIDDTIKTLAPLLDNYAALDCKSILSDYINNEIDLYESAKSNKCKDTYKYKILVGASMGGSLVDPTFLECYCKTINSAFDIVVLYSLQSTKIKPHQEFENENEVIEELEMELYKTIKSYDIFSYDPSINLENIKMDYVLIKSSHSSEPFLMLYKTSNKPKYKEDYLTDPETREIVNFMLGQKLE